MEALQKKFYLKSFIIILLSLMFVGLGMIYSSSYMFSKEEFGNPSYIFIKQVIFLILSVLTIGILSKSKFEFWFKNIFYLHLFFTFLVFLTFIPSIGVTIKGASRWLNLGFTTLQPGEFVKYTTLISAISYFHQFEGFTDRLRLKYGAILFFPLVLLMLQPDYGMFFLCFSNIIFACFLSSFPRKWFYGFLFTSVIAMSGLLVLAPYRVKRLMSYLDPWKDPMNSGFQVIQSFLGFAHGSFWGAGLGNSREKLFYLPEAYNDFIFSVIGEELGFIGVFVLVSLFLAFTYVGFKLVFSLKNSIKSTFGILVITTICFQALLNMGVVLGMLPTKGLNLPFISYGGSSLLANAILLGLFFSLFINTYVPRETSHMEFN